MKIIIISNVFPPGYVGGYELGAYEIARRLAANGHEIFVMTSNYFLDDDREIVGLQVDRVLNCSVLSHNRLVQPDGDLRGQFCDWQNIRVLGSALRRYLPDLVISFNLAGLGPAAIYQFLGACNVPRVSYFMDTPFGSYPHLAHPWNEYQRVFTPVKSIDLGKIISMSENLTRELRAVVQDLSIETANHVPGWVDVPHPPLCRLTNDQRENETRFVFCGRVAEHKGVDLIISASEQLVRRGHNNFQIDIFGAGHVTHFTREVQRRGLQQHIHYQGAIAKSEMLRRFADYDAMLFPTWEREPFGFTVPEAASAGCISIITSSIGAAEWFLDGIDCLKIARSVDAIERAMLQVIEMDQADLARMSDAACTNAQVNMNFEKWISVVEDICVAESRGRDSLDFSHVRAVEASFLALNDLWRSGFDLR